MNLEQEFSLADLRGMVESFNERHPSMIDFNRRPLNTEISIALEASEILEKAKFGEDYSDELADVLIYLFVLSGNMGIDLADELIKKIAENEIRFPSERFQGNADDFIREYRNRKRELGERK